MLQLKMIVNNNKNILKTDWWLNTSQLNIWSCKYLKQCHENTHSSPCNLFVDRLDLDLSYLTQDSVQRLYFGLTPLIPFDLSFKIITIKDHYPCDDNHRLLYLSSYRITCLARDIQNKYNNTVLQASMGTNVPHFTGLLYLYKPEHGS